MPSAVDEITWLHPDPSASPPPIAPLAASRLRVPLSPFLVAVLGRRAARKQGRCRGPIGGWPSAPSKIALVMTGLRFATVLAQALRARSLPSAGTCADVRVWIGRRSVPAGPPDGDGDGGKGGRERPGLPRIWVGTGPASRVSHAPCRWSVCPDKCGPDRVQIGAQFLCTNEVTIVPADVLVIELPRCLL